MPLWKKIVRICVALATFIIVLLVGGLVVLDWYLGSDTLKKQVQDVVSERTGLDVLITGDLGVSVYPYFGLETGDVVVLNPEGFAQPEMATASSVVAKVLLLPLLERKVEFGVVGIDHLDFHLLRTASGETNVDHLLEPGAAATGTPTLEWNGFKLSAVTIRGLRLDHAHFRFSDLSDGTELTASDVKLRTGLVQLDTATQFGIEADVAWPGQEVEASIAWTGDLLAGPEFTWMQVPESKLQCSVAAPFLVGKHGRTQFTAAVQLDTRNESLSVEGFKLGLPELLLTGNLSGTSLLSEPQVTGNLSAAQFHVTSALNHYFSGLIPPKDPGIFQDGSFQFDFAIGPDNLEVTNLIASCDKTILKGAFGVAHFDDPLFTFDVVGDSLDFDRYYRIFIVDEPFVLHDFGPEFLGAVRAEGSLQVDDVILATGEFTDFHAEVSAANGTSTLQITSAKLWDGDATGELIFNVRHEGGEDHPLSLAARLEVDNGAASQMPLINSESRVFQGRGKVSYSCAMPETLFQKSTNIDEVLRHTSAEVGYELGSGLMLSGLKEKTREKTFFDSARLSAKFSASGERSPDDAYGYKAGLSLKVTSKSEPYVLAARFSGPVQVSSALDSLKVVNAQVGGQLSGKHLPPGETMLVASTTLTLDTATGTLRARDTTLEANAGTVKADISGHRIFEKDYTYAGPVTFTADPRLAFGLVDVEIGPTRDEKVLRAFDGGFDLALTSKLAVLANIDVVFDDTHGTGKIRIEDFETGHSTFQLKADALDINRYRPPKKVRTPGKCGEPKVPSVPLPLRTLSSADIDGDLFVGDFRIFDLSFKSLTSHATMKDGKLQLPDMKSDFYDGKVIGSFFGTATREALDCDIELHADSFDGGKFMVDIIQKQYVDGDTSMNFKIHTTGATDDEFIANMSGQADVEILKGSYRFSGEQNPPAGSKATDYIQNNRNTFDYARATFAVDQSVFMTEDFKMENSFLTAIGRGNFNLDKDTIDLELNAEYTVLPTMIPIYIIDCLHDPGVSVPSAEILGNTVLEVIELPLKPFQYLRDLLF